MCACVILGICLAAGIRSIAISQYCSGGTRFRLRLFHSALLLFQFSFFQPTLDSTWVAHPITNDSNVTNDTSSNNGNINNAKNYTTKNHTPSSWAVRPAPVVVVDLGPHWASNAQMSQAAWTHAGREALELLQVVH